MSPGLMPGGELLSTDRGKSSRTGYTGGELFGLADRPANFYMQGSMGHASSIGLGVALTLCWSKTWPQGLIRSFRRPVRTR
jgi:hypothetical protein